LNNKNIDFFADFLKQEIQIFSFLETHHLGKPKLFGIREKYNTIEIEGQKLARKERPKGGIIVGWRREIDAFVDANQISENTVQVRFSKEGSKVILFFSYFSPEVSKDAQCVKFMEGLENSTDQIILLGDYNARIGRKGTQDEDRCSKDEVVNQRGVKLLEVLRLGSFNIANGRINRDEVGH